ncbi:MAG: hypothetical protein N2C14_29950 [Planctomycetales bacterium]
MRNFIRKALLGIAAAALVALLLLGGTYYGSQSTPDFYEQALSVPSETLEQGSDEMVAKTTALISLAKRKGRWEAVFTEQEINGWLGVDLPRKHHDFLPPDFEEPRLVIRPDGARLACRWTYRGLTTVVSVDLEVYLAQPDELAVRIHAARAGAVPLPLTQILEHLGEKAKQAEARVRWARDEGDPVALIGIPPVEDGKLLRRIERIELREGELYLSGVTETDRGDKKSSALHASQSPVQVGRRLLEKVKAQR